MTAVVEVSLDEADELGAGTAIDLGGLSSHVTMSVFTDGAPTHVSVALQGSPDGEHWLNLGESGAGMVSSNRHLVKHVRAYLAVLEGGTDPTVTVVIAASVELDAEEPE